VEKVFGCAFIVVLRFEIDLAELAGSIGCPGAVAAESPTEPGKNRESRSNVQRPSVASRALYRWFAMKR
jgi:hypothetical protein